MVMCLVEKEIRKQLKALFLLLLVIFTFLYRDANALEVKSEIFTYFKSELGFNDLYEGGSRQRGNGVDIERLRILGTDKFNDTWEAKFRFDLIPSLIVREAVFIGSSFLLSGDRLRFGAFNHPMHEFFFSGMKTRWLSKNAGLDGSENSTFTPGWTNGVAYKVALLESLSLEFLYTSNESNADSNGSDDRENEIGLSAYVKILDQLKLHLNYGLTTTDRNANGYQKLSRIISQLQYVDSHLRATLEYFQTEQIMPDSKEKDSILAISAHLFYLKKYGLFVKFFTGYAKFNSNEVITYESSLEHKLSIGPTTELVNGKLSAALLFELVSYQSGVQTGGFERKDDKSLMLKLAAMF